MRSSILTLCVLLVSARGAGANTVTLFPVKDNSLYSESGTLSNGMGQLFCGVNALGNVRRCLVQFDVAAVIPAGSTITSATLTLQVTATNPGLPLDIGPRRALEAWGEANSLAGLGGGAGGPALPGDATWTHAFFNTVPWAASGGGFFGSASASLVLTQVGSYTWASTPALVADVQLFLDTPASNFGWLFLASDETTPATAKRFAPRGSPAGPPRLVVTYTPFVPPSPFTHFCFGDGTGTACPCANSGASGRGCANSTFVNGASLTPSGNPGLANDTFVITASSIAGPGLFIQGSSTFAGGLGIAFGDGLLCCGALTRLGVVFPNGSSASYPGGLTPNPIHIGGGPINAGEVRNYQCWYRDAFTFCSDATFNLTQSVSVAWGQ